MCISSLFCFVLFVYHILVVLFFSLLGKVQLSYSRIFDNVLDHMMDAKCKYDVELMRRRQETMTLHDDMIETKTKLAEAIRHLQYVRAVCLSVFVVLLLFLFFLALFCLAFFFILCVLLRFSCLVLMLCCCGNREVVRTKDKQLQELTVTNTKLEEENRVVVSLLRNDPSTLSICHTLCLMCFFIPSFGFSSFCCCCFFASCCFVRLCDIFCFFCVCACPCLSVHVCVMHLFVCIE